MNAARPETPAIATEVVPAEARARQLAGALLVDVREDDERAAGSPLDAVGMPLASVAARIGAAAETSREIFAICASGARSLRAAAMLRDMGYARAASVNGGFQRWLREGLPLAAGALDADASERYSRHLRLDEVGVAGQQKLARARVAMLGAGGLGSPAALYLAAAGVGTLTLIDDDVVDRSNLQRQILHTDASVGTPKTASAAATLRALNPHISIREHATRLEAANVEMLIADHDVVIDGADNFPSRYLLSAACLRLRIPLVYGAVHRFTGQLSVFDARRDDSPCYRCLFAEPPAAEDAPNCAEAGVLGVLPGVIGTLQATEAIKIVLGIGAPLVGRLLCYDALSATFRELRLSRDAECPGCGAAATFTGYEDIARLCSAH
ncbi:MAG: molybdopterin-synthase adenylyltransferase MoeB [Rudaea sp.]